MTVLSWSPVAAETVELAANIVVSHGQERHEITDDFPPEVVSTACAIILGA